MTRWSGAPTSSRAARAPALVLALALAQGGAACGEDTSPHFGTTDRHGRDVHTLVVNNGSEPEYLDPGKAHDTASSVLVDHLFEGLAVNGPDAEPVPGVAERWDQTADNRFFRFHLRADARWSDGQPVTAHDFAYAWRRVLTPATGSQSASNLHVLANGEAFHLGRLRTTKAEVVVRAGPDAGAAEVARLPGGTAVMVLARSPLVLRTRAALLPAVPAGVTEVLVDEADPRQKTPDKVALVGGTLAEAPLGDEALRGAKAVLLRRLGPVKCDGAEDHWLEVMVGEARGVVAGCATKPDPKAPVALVARHTLLPTFDPQKAPPVVPAPTEPLGFVDVTALESDASVLGVRATSDRVLEVELARPAPFFLDLLTHASTYPVRRDLVERFEAAGDPDGWMRTEHLIGNGVYVLEDWRFRYEITMRRNPHHRYHDALAIHRVRWLEVESYHSAMNLYKTGDLDYLGDNSSLPSEYLTRLSKKKDFEQTEYLGTYWYELNTKVPPLGDPRVRKALDLAIDKRQLIARVVQGGQSPATHFVPDFTGLGYAEAAAADRARGADPFAGKDHDFDAERARALLAEAGFPVEGAEGSRRAVGMPPLEILYNTSEGHKKIAVAIQDMWKTHLGVSVNLRNEEWKVMLKNVRDRNFQIVRFGWIADYNHAHTFLDTFLSESPNNRTGWASPAFDATLERAASTADPKESMRLYREAEALAVDARAKIPLYFYTKSTLIKPYVKGFDFNARNRHLAQWMRIDPSWQTSTSDAPAMPVPAFPPPGAY